MGPVDAPAELGKRVQRGGLADVHRVAVVHGQHATSQRRRGLPHLAGVAHEHRAVQRPRGDGAVPVLGDVSPEQLRGRRRQAANPLRHQRADS